MALRFPRRPSFWGQNMFIDGSRAEIGNAEGEQKSTLKSVISQLRLSMKSEAPTRGVLILPDREKSTDIECAKRMGSGNCVNANSTLFRRPSPQSGATEPRVFPRKLSIFLFSNQISWIYDPVKWADYTKAIESWGRDHAQGQVQIPMETVRKFQEVKMPDIKARLPAKLAGTRQYPGPIVLLDGLPYHHEYNFLIYKGWDPILAKKLIKINAGNKVAASIGLFHKPLQDEIKSADPQEFQNNLDRLSRTALLLSFQRYRKYQALRKYSQERKRTLETNIFKCNDPFHHLPRVTVRGIESATCLCKHLKKGKRTHTQLRGKALTSSRKPKKKPKFPKLGNDARKLGNDARTIPQIFKRLKEGKTADPIMDARDRSLRFPRS